MRMIFAITLLLAGAFAAQAQQKETVQSLLAQDFVAVGAVTSPAGPGVFMQKKTKMYLCFVSETPQSAVVSTRYCKPVE